MNNNTKSLLQLHFEGPSVQNRSILWEDLSQFVTNLDVAIQRVINVLETGTGIRIGRPTRVFQTLTALEFVAMTSGSVKIDLNLRREEDLLPGFDLGQQAILKLTDGLVKIAKNGEDVPLPDGFDGGVLTALREAGRILDRGIDIVHISAIDHLPAGRAEYDRPVRERILSKIHKLEQVWAQVEGRLLMAELKEGSLRCRLHPSADAPVLCSFEEEMIPAIIRNLRRFVRVHGEVNIDPLTNKIHSLFVRDLESIEEPSAIPVSLPPISTFWRPKTFDELAIEQGIYPLEDWEKLVGNWPEDADFDSFLQAVQGS